jgi:hypothetical protein
MLAESPFPRRWCGPSRFYANQTLSGSCKEGRIVKSLGLNRTHLKSPGGDRSHHIAEGPLLLALVESHKGHIAIVPHFCTKDGQARHLPFLTRISGPLGFRHKKGVLYFQTCWDEIFDYDISKVIWTFKSHFHLKQLALGQAPGDDTVTCAIEESPRYRQSSGHGGFRRPKLKRDSLICDEGKGLS